MNNRSNTGWRKGRLITRGLAAATVVAVLTSPALVHALPVIIDFQGDTGGSLTESGSTVSGTAAIDSVLGVNTPLHADGGGPGLAVSGGILTINTVTDTLTISGGVPAAGIAAGSPLLIGTLDSATVTNLTSGLLMVTATGVDAINPALNQFFGLPANQLFDLTGVTVASQQDTTNMFTPFSTDVASAATPEPISLILFGSGLGGLGLLRRRA